jgi:hypothetical protein
MTRGDAGWLSVLKLQQWQISTPPIAEKVAPGLVTRWCVKKCRYETHGDGGDIYRPGAGACEKIVGWLDQRAASFETAASQLPQDEEIAQCSGESPHFLTASFADVTQGVAICHR